MNEDQLKKLLNQELAAFFGQMTRHFDERLDSLEASKADRQQVARLQNSLDGIAKRLETDEHERAAITSQLNRHQNWIIRATDKLQIGYDEAA
jgi:hypothetical protein